MKYKDKILLTDMDGTLLDSKGRISNKNIDAIKFFISEGGRFGIATGRGVKNALIHIKELPINFHSIFLNGSVLFDVVNNKPLKTNYLSKEEIIPILKRCLHLSPNVNIQIHSEVDGFFVSDINHANQEVVDDHLPYGFVNLDEILNIEWTKVLFYGNSSELNWLENQLSHLLEGNKIDTVYSCEFFYEILPKASNKGGMIEELHKIKGNKHQIYTVGNFYNDLEMIEKADFGIFTENTPEELRAGHPNICTNCDNNAIADVIYNFMN